MNSLLFIVGFTAFSLSSTAPMLCSTTYRQSYKQLTDHIQPPAARVEKHYEWSAEPNIVQQFVPEEYHSKVYEYSLRFGVPLEMIVGIGQVESGWTDWAVSPENDNGTIDLGMFQLNSRYLDLFIDSYWDRDEPFDVFYWEHNLYLSVQQMAFLLEIFDRDVHLATSAYNRGRGWVANRGNYYGYLNKVLNVQRIAGIL